MKLNILLPAILCGACTQGLGPVVPETSMERKMIGLLQKFDHWDDNGDGQLDEEELAMGLEGSGHEASNVIDFYDTDGDRRISLGEAQAGYKRAAEAERRVEARKAAEGGAR